MLFMDTESPSERTQHRFWTKFSVNSVCPLLDQEHIQKHEVCSLLKGECLATFSELGAPYISSLNLLWKS